MTCSSFGQDARLLPLTCPKHGDLVSHGTHLVCAMLKIQSQKLTQALRNPSTKLTGEFYRIPLFIVLNNESSALKAARVNEWFAVMG